MEMLRLVRGEIDFINTLDGESFEKLGKTQEATNTYRELLRNQKLANFSEAIEARKRLEALGQGS